ncbi:hypothetical protein Sste5346_006282 [Sporothrix stenoceras]|uniref:Molybdopterin synthase sulfur carrier subunit n=1 Tax=Sporothrix stenoceras TaxID=5173 RepID=A0ABR3Z2P0_9PEZI
MSTPPRPPKGHFNMLYFAAATSYTQKDYESLPAPLPLSELFATLEKRYSGIRAGVLDGSMVTINLEYVDVEADAASTVIQEGDEVAVIPPVSSGNGVCSFSTEGVAVGVPDGNGLSGRRSSVATRHDRTEDHWTRRSRRITTTSSHSSSATTSVLDPATSAVRLVIVDTWQPSGRVRSSHRSAQ